MKRFTLIFLLSITNSIFCQDDLCLKQKGNWVMNKNPESSPPSELALQKKIVTATHDMVRNAYVPMGVTMEWAGVYPSIRKEEPVASFSYRSMAFPFLCKPDGTFSVPHETNSSYNILFNSFGYGSLYDTVETGGRSEGYFSLLHGIPKEIAKGIWAFPDKPASLGFGRSGKNRLWLITYDGKLPWSFVSRKEFLLKRKRILEMEKENELRSAKERIVNIEQEKKLKEQEYKDNPAKLDKFMKGTWTPMHDNYERIFREIEPRYKKALEQLSDQLSAPESELTKNAIVVPSQKNSYDFSFTDKDEPFALILIKPNPAYFNKTVQKSVPQFISVEFTWDHENLSLTHFAKGINSALDLDFLKSIIGKSVIASQPSGKGNAYANGL